jgi:hypothetical protein
MNTAKRRLLTGGVLTALAVAALLTLANRSVVYAAEGDEVEYTFGRPLKKGEQTYDWYRKTHADWAAQRYGVDPKAVGDGMDTWHWWCGVDNPRFWRETAKLTSKKEKKLLEFNTCPDFIEDRGHTYGRELGDDDKHALIEFMKHF